MSWERPLNVSCLAANTPQCLERIVAAKVAKIMISYCVPIELKTFSEDPSNCNLNYSKLDEAILKTSGDSELFLKTRECFMIMKTWWEKSHLFGGFGSPLRKLIQDSVSCLLDHLDIYSYCPLFKFTCQLCFTREAGAFYQNNYEIIIEMPKSLCEQYLLFLRDLGPFQIEHFLNTYMIMGCQWTFAYILKNAPFLRSLHLCHKGNDYFICHVGPNCPNLETFVIDSFLGKLTVSEPFLYRTFFCGRDKEEVVGEKGHQLTPVKLAFPKLIQVDLGKSREAQEFLCVLSCYYPHLRSLSCHSSNLVASGLLRAYTVFRGYPFVSFHIQDLCLTCECLIHLDEGILTRYFPKIRHVTLSFDSTLKGQLDIIKEKCVCFLSNCGVSSLTVHIPLEGTEDNHLQNILLPLFAAIGSAVKCLQFLLMRKVDVSLVWSLVNACPALELLGLSLFVDASFSGRSVGSVALRPFLHLESFSASFEKIEDAGAFFVQVEEILSKAPQVTFLELLLPAAASTWILNLSAKGVLKKVSKLVLGFGVELSLEHEPDYDVDDNPNVTLDVDVYILLIRGLTALRTLVLLGVFPGVTGKLKRVYSRSQLQIVPRRRTCVAYHGLYSKYRYSP